MACLYMKPTTILFLFELEQCVEHVFDELSQYMHDVSKKFEYFVSFLRQNCITLIKKNIIIISITRLYY